LSSGCQPCGAAACIFDEQAKRAEGAPVFTLDLSRPVGEERGRSRRRRSDSHVPTRPGGCLCAHEIVEEAQARASAAARTDGEIWTIPASQLRRWAAHRNHPSVDHRWLELAGAIRPNHHPAPPRPIDMDWGAGRSVPASDAPGRFDVSRRADSRRREEYRGPWPRPRRQARAEQLTQGRTRCAARRSSHQRGLGSGGDPTPIATRQTATIPARASRQPRRREPPRA
jgi:hypothetical protein